MGFSKKILVPIDFTKVSDIAIEHALLMGKTILADIHLIHIVENKKSYEIYWERKNSNCRSNYF